MCRLPKENIACQREKEWSALSAAINHPIATTIIPPNARIDNTTLVGWSHEVMRFTFATLEEPILTKNPYVNPPIIPNRSNTG